MRGLLQFAQNRLLVYERSNYGLRRLHDCDDLLLLVQSGRNRKTERSHLRLVRGRKVGSPLGNAVEVSLSTV